MEEGEGVIGGRIEAEENIISRKGFSRERMSRSRGMEGPWAAADGGEGMYGGEGMCRGRVEGLSMGTTGVKAVSNLVIGRITTLDLTINALHLPMLLGTPSIKIHGDVQQKRDRAERERS